MSQFHVRGRTYVWTWLALLVLTTVTLLVSGANVGRAELPIALAIATVKALLVALFFMHLAEERFAYRLAPLLAVLYLLLLVGLTVADVSTR